MQCLDIVLRFSMTMRPDVASFARGIFLSDPRHCNPIGSGAEVSAILAAAIQCSSFCASYCCKPSAKSMCKLLTCMLLGCKNLELQTLAVMIFLTLFSTITTSHACAAGYA